MSIRIRHLPVLLAIGALAACSAESVTGVSAAAELPQPRPTFSVVEAGAAGAATAVTVGTADASATSVGAR